ncbi:MAG: hypothetical protein HZB15_15335 [Actinobacteria bacterium]|nr:hypothetical protein [Actinomycetota bacterium]
MTTIHTPLSRRSLLVSLVGAPVLATFVAACGDPDAEPASSPTTGGPAPSTAPSAPDTTTPSTDALPIDHLTGADDVILRYGREGGFVPVGVSFVNQPSLLISGDGRVFAPGVTTMEYPGPLLLPMAVRSITEAGIQTLLAAADAAGLMASPPPDYTAEANVTDMPDTVVTISTGGGTYRHSAYALGFPTDEQGNPADETTPARVALLGFTRLLDDLTTTVGAAELGDETIFEPAEYRLQARAVTEADLEGMDPAPTIVDWPASTGLDLAGAAECARLSAPAAGSVFADADTATYFRQGDALYSIAVAGVLPGGPVC